MSEIFPEDSFEVSKNPARESGDLSVNPSSEANTRTEKIGDIVFIVTTLKPQRAGRKRQFEGLGGRAVPYTGTIHARESSRFGDQVERYSDR